MKTNPTSSVNITRILSAIVITYLLVTCDVDSSNNFPRVPDVGLFIYAEANQHESQDEAQLAAAVFKDGEPVDLVAGIPPAKCHHQRGEGELVKDKPVCV